MKIAVSSNGNNLDSQIDPRFGRCMVFLIVDTDDMSFEAFNNESIALGGGAGIQAAQFVTSKGAKAVLTGHVGPNAVKALTAAGVSVFVGQAGTVREALERYNSGKLEPTQTANVSDHYGMSDGGSAQTTDPGDSGGDRAQNTVPGSGGSPAGRGRGMGGGGRGCGMGGGGRGRGMGGGGRGCGMGGGRNRV